MQISFIPERPEILRREPSAVVQFVCPGPWVLAAGRTSSGAKHIKLLKRLEFPFTYASAAVKSCEPRPSLEAVPGMAWSVSMPCNARAAAAVMLTTSAVQDGQVQADAGPGPSNASTGSTQPGMGFGTKPPPHPQAGTLGIAQRSSQRLAQQERTASTQPLDASTAPRAALSGVGSLNFWSCRPGGHATSSLVSPGPHGSCEIF